MHNETYPTLGMGIGTIGPEPRLESGDIDHGKLQEFYSALQGDTYFSSTDGVIPTACVDGRSPAAGEAKLTPKSAAGTLSVVVGDALTHGRYMKPDENAAGHAQHVYAFLRDNEFKVGGHDATHASGDNCGCGAEDNFGRIFGFIGEHGDELREALISLGVQISEGTHQSLMERVALLTQDGYANVTGKALRQAYVNAAGEASIETLDGPHNEVCVVVNTKDGTLDRAKLRAAYGDKYLAFGVDLVALRKTAEIVAETDDEAEQMYTAMLYYNYATAAVLSHPSLCVVAR